MQMKKSLLQVTKAYYSKAVTAQKQHLRNNKKVFRIYVYCCTVIYKWVGGIIPINQYADKGRKDAYMDKIFFPDPCVGQQMRVLQ